MALTWFTADFSLIIFETCSVARSAISHPVASPPNAFPDSVLFTEKPSGHDLWMSSIRSMMPAPAGSQ